MKVTPVETTMQINLFSKGPDSYRAVLDMKEASDYGIYQIYGVHPVYGSDTLLYIGQAKGETFGHRFAQSDRTWMAAECMGDSNTASIRIHTGRVHVKDDRHPGNARWDEWIDCAEKLLISSHSPAWNAKEVGGLKEKETDSYKDCHVLNWGQYGHLQPEVSGARHTWVVWNELADKPLANE